MIQSRCFSFFLALILALTLAIPAGAQVSVTTQQNDNARTGQNLQETILNTSNVNVSNFGKLFTLGVDGYVYAQPLYLSNVNINGQSHNVLFVTTQHNSVYAFDADKAGPPLWQVSLGAMVPTSDICTTAQPPQPSNCYPDIMPYIGITATPVIDPQSGTIFVVAKVKNPDSTYHFRLHALDVTTGADKVPAAYIDGSTVTGFDPLKHLQRPGLLLLNGTVYIGFGSAGDFPDWHGWVMGYDAQTLTQTAVFNTTPDAAYQPGGGIWGGGKGLLTDGTYIYVATSNGSFTAPSGNNYASSFIKLTTPGLKETDFFAPYDQNLLNGSNADLGSGGLILLPGTPKAIVGGGKEGILYLVDTANMGQNSATTNNILQYFQATNAYPDGMIMGGPIFWNNSSTPWLYIWGPDDVIKAFQYDSTSRQFRNCSGHVCTPVSQGTIKSPVGNSNLAALSISANGSQSGSGIVWASGPSSGDANEQTQPGILVAYDASNLSHKLWDSNLDLSRDAVGSYAKFTPPTIANGKVYEPAFVGPDQPGQDAGQVVVYGLFSQTSADFAMAASPSSFTVNPGQSASYSINITPQAGFNGSVSFACAGLPSGAACSFSPQTVTGTGTSTLTITTAGPTALLLPSQKRLAPLFAFWLPLPGMALAGLGFRAAGRRRRLALWFTVIMLLAILALVGCGGGGSSSGGGGGGGGGTPAGSYTITV
ncbi:MAG TPA: hypothetical protein VKT29_11820, partial [Terriglobales bacterium]|nr:hypothetical protein [Terriglobales bacterium]